jgi:hypothetical protein
VQLSVPAPVIEPFAQVRPVNAGTPVPLRLTVVVAPVEELLVSVRAPLAAPAAAGANCTVSVAVCPGESDSGNTAPEALKPVPLMAAALTVNGATPVEVSTTVCVAVELTETLPNPRFVVLTLSVAA